MRPFEIKDCWINVGFKADDYTAIKQCCDKLTEIQILLCVYIYSTSTEVLEEINLKMDMLLDMLKYFFSK